MNRRYVITLLTALVTLGLRANSNVTFKLIYDDTMLTPLLVEARTPGKRSVNQQTWHKLKEVTLSLPDGTYDLHVTFCNYNPSMPANQQCDFYHSYTHVIKELVNVSSDMTVEMDASTATNHITFEPVTPQGEPFRHMTLRQDPSTGQSYLDNKDANIKVETITLFVSNSDYGELVGTNLSSIHDVADGTSSAHSLDVKVNDVSDRYSFSQVRIACDFDDRIHLIGLSHKGIPSGPITNTTDSWQQVTESFQYTPEYENLTRDGILSGIDVTAAVNSTKALDITQQFTDELPSVMVSWGRDAASSGAVPKFTVTPRIYEYDEQLTSVTDRSQLAIHGCPIELTPTATRYVNSQNPHFAFDRDAFQCTMGDNVPVTRMIMHAFSEGNSIKTVNYVPTFVGRYGEVREADEIGFEAEIFYNGQPVHQGYPDLNSWASIWAADTHAAGVMTARFTNSNATFKGVDGKSVTEITYTEGKNDMCAPAVQMLSLTDSYAQPLNTYASGQQMVVKVAAGDADGNGRTNSYTEAKSIKLEYAPHQSDVFTHISTRFISGATSTQIWSVYGGEMQAPLQHGLYDIRITAEDYAGNRSVQTISPAFAVADAASINDPAADHVATTIARATCSNGTLTLWGTDGGDFTIYSSDGKTILIGKGQTADIEALTPGIYLVCAGKAKIKFYNPGKH